MLGVFACIAAAPRARGDIISEIGGDTRNFVILYEGTGGNSLTLNQNNGNITGNIGIGGTGKFDTSGGCSGQCKITGNIDFSAANTGQFTGNPGTTITGTENYSQSDVSTDLTDVNNFSSTVGGESGTNVSINLNNGQSQTIMASSGVLNGNNRIFNVTGFQFNNGATLTIQGDVAGDNVVLNFVNISPQFGGTVILSGITADQVVFNITGNQTLQINTNGSTVQGVFIDPNGTVSVNHSVVYGQIFGGSGGNMQLVSGEYITAPTPEPASIFLLATVLFGAVLVIKRRRTTARRPRRTTA